MNNKIRIFDQQNDFAHDLQKMLEEKDFNVTIDDSFSDFESDQILINYQLINTLQRDQIESIFKKLNKSRFAVYNVPADASRKTAFYKLGSFRVFDSYNTEEEIAFYIKNLASFELNDADKRESRISGNLRHYNLQELINSFIKEKTSGVLNLKTDACSGKIIFNRGDIDDCMAGYLKEEEAFYYMLTWVNGTYSMRKSEIKNPRHKIQLSPLGLLLRGEEIKAKYIDRMSQLGKGEFQIKLKHKGDILPKYKNSEFKELAERIISFKSINEILASSSLPIIKTLDWILELKEEKHIVIKEDIDIDYTDLPELSSGLIERFFNTDECTQLRYHLKAEEINSGKVLILSTNKNDKAKFIQTLNMGSRTAVKSEKEIEFTQIEVDDYFNLMVFGISLDKKFTDKIIKLSEGLLGYIFLVNTDEKQDVEYFNYIFSNLISRFNVPWTVALTGKKELKYKLNLTEERELFKCNPEDKDSVKQVFLSILNTGEEQ